jgi:enterochelin esterase family protein
MILVALPGAAQRRPPALKSPELHPDRTVTFRISAPKAAEVKISGDLIKDAQVMKKDEKGVWSITLGPLRPDIYTYRYTVDGLSVIDPVNQAQPPTMLEVPGDGPMPWDVRAVAHGTVQERWYSSKSLDYVRRVFIYTPPNYEKSNSKYPVLYLLHGAGTSNESVWTDSGRAHVVVDNLMADGKLKPLVIVMPYGYANYPISPKAVGPDAVHRERVGFERDLIEDLIPFVQANFRVYTDREHRAIAGLSMGGGQALGTGLTHPELFSRVAAFSPAIGAVTAPESGGLDLKAATADSKKVNQEYKLLWIGCGTDDTLYKGIQDFDKMLSSQGVKHTFKSTDGGHNWVNFRRYFVETVPMLWPQG